MKTKGYLFALLSAVTYGLIPLFVLPIKALHYSMDVTLFYRFLISAAFVLGFSIYSSEELRITKLEFLRYLTLGILFALSSEFLFLAYDYLSAGIASTILFVYPAIVAIIMFAFYGEKITRITAVSMCIIFAGIYLLSTKENALDINITGLFIAVLSALCYALYIVKINSNKVKTPILKITFYSLLFSSAYYFIKSILLDESLILPSARMFFDISLFGFLTSVVSILALVYAIQKIGSTPTSIMGALEPVVAVGISVFFFGEDLNLKLGIGMVLILSGVIINIIGDNKKIIETPPIKTD